LLSHTKKPYLKLKKNTPNPNLSLLLNSAKKLLKNLQDLK
jgi:hypothetical protein